MHHITKLPQYIWFCYNGLCCRQETTTCWFLSTTPTTSLSLQCSDGRQYWFILSYHHHRTSM